METDWILQRFCEKTFTNLQERSTKQATLIALYRFSYCNFIHSFPSFILISTNMQQFSLALQSSQHRFKFEDAISTIALRPSPT